jgi:hypothetical protein
MSLIKQNWRKARVTCFGDMGVTTSGDSRIFPFPAKLRGTFDKPGQNI